MEFLRSYGKLVALFVAPTVWALHFNFSYWVAAVYCAKAGREATLDPARLIVVALTVVALAAIFALGAYAYGQHRRGRADVPHGDDTTADRERFLGFATLLLCGLSAVAVIYTAIVVFFFASCQ